MPELPEVECVVRRLRPRLVGRRIVDFQSRWAPSVSPSPARVRRAIGGRRVDDVTRRAKYIVLHLDDGAHLLIHLRMSGRLEWSAGPSSANRAPRGPKPDDHACACRHVRSWWDLDSGDRLLFDDSRKFGRVMHTRDLAAATGHLGVEPFDRALDGAALGRLLRSRSRLLKPLLLDQSVIAGLGNIYTDEALFLAGLHPLTHSDELSDSQIMDLYTAIGRVLRDGIRRGGASIDWVYPGGSMQHSFRVYGRTGQPCKRCRSRVVALRVGQRGTHVCLKCQPPPGRTRLAGAGHRRVRANSAALRA